MNLTCDIIFLNFAEVIKVKSHMTKILKSTIFKISQELSENQLSKHLEAKHSYLEKKKKQSLTVLSK